MSKKEISATYNLIKVKRNEITRLRKQINDLEMKQLSIPGEMHRIELKIIDLQAEINQLENMIYKV